MKTIFIKTFAFVFRALLALLLGAVLLHSCVTYEKCVQKFGNTKVDTVFTIQVDTFQITETIKDSVIKRIPGEKVVLHDTIPCPELINKTFSGSSERGTVKATVEIKDNNIDVHCNADSLLEVLRTRDKTILVLQKELATVKQTTAFVDNRAWYEKLPWYVYAVVGLVALLFLSLAIKKLIS